jgi:coenzyme PQQ precursor peptide PqqA
MGRDRTSAVQATAIDAQSGALHTDRPGTHVSFSRFRVTIETARRNSMKLEWHKPEVTEQEVGLEVTSYASAELDPA